MAEKPSYKQLVEQVKTRFDGKFDDPAPREHFNIATSTLEENAQERTVNRIRTVAESSKSLHNSKEKKISNQVRKMLIKSKAEGNPNLSEEDRLYIMVNFLETQTSKCVYVPAFQTVGNVLEALGTRYTREAFGSPTRPEGVTLQGTFADDDERLHWLPKAARVDSIFEQGSEVDVSVKNVSDAPPAPLADAAEQPPMLETQGDVTDQHHKAAVAERSSESSLLEADAKKPRMEGDEGEIDAVSPSEQEEKKEAEAAYGAFSVNIVQGKTTHPLEGIRPDMIVAELKSLVAQVTGVPASRQKLVFRGVLRDQDLISATPLKPGCKITLMTTGKW